MKRKLVRLLIPCIIILVLVNNTSCSTTPGESLKLIQLEGFLCELTGGEWVMSYDISIRGYCDRDKDIQEDANKELEELEALLEDQKPDIDAANSAEESKEDEIPPLSLEECYASTDEFALVVINMSKEPGSRGVYCHGDYSVKNLSDYNLKVIWRSHMYTGEMESLEYTRPESIPVGSILTREFNQTSYTDGKKTFDLATGMIVFYDLEECNLLVPEKNKFIEIPNPCK